MHRLRSTWLALIGGLLLVGLSVSSVFAARPAATEDGTRGQQIAAFVHELVFGSTDEEETPDEEQVEEEEQPEEAEELEGEQEDQSESEDETTEDVEESDTEASSHGQCVAEEASDKSDEDDSADPEFTNHGAFVSEAARVTCWQTDDEEATDEDAVLDSGAEITSPDEGDTTELSAKEQRKADRDAAKADRKAAKASNAGGNGHGRGGGRP